MPAARSSVKKINGDRRRNSRRKINSGTTGRRMQMVHSISKRRKMIMESIGIKTIKICRLIRMGSRSFRSSNQIKNLDNTSKREEMTKTMALSM